MFSCITLEMAEFRGADVHFLKDALDRVFNDMGNVLLTDYETKLIRAILDNTNLNLGVYDSALTQLAHERPWLVTVHYKNYQLELVMKDTNSQIIDYQECDWFYTTIFYLFKNSGKLKALAKKSSWSTYNMVWFTKAEWYRVWLQSPEKMTA